MSPSRPDETSPAPGTGEIEALAAQFLAQLQGGASPDRQALVRAHPHLGARLEERLALAEMMYHVGLAPQESQSGESSTVRPEDPSAGASASLLPTLVSGEKPMRQVGRRGNPPDYEIFAELGHGGMGVVYKALQKSLNRVVALKMIRAGAHAGPDLLARFHIEAEALASLQHPNIVQVYDVGEHDGCPYMAMEYLDGGSLGDLLAGVRQPPRAAAELVEKLARAIHAAHLRGIVHRDLKPANVLLQIADAALRIEGQAPLKQSAICNLQSAIPKVTDFGLAKRFAAGKGQTATGAVMGTPSYMAPEQAWGRVSEIGPPADVYSLGAILYEMLTGRPPFQGETGMDTLKRLTSEEPDAPSRLCPKLPRDLETICLKCLEKEPARRYVTALDMADDLRRFLDGEPIAARPAGTAERTWKWAKRRPTLAALIGVSVAAACTLAVVGVSWSVQVRGERDRARSSLQVARKAIDDLYGKMASERLFDEPQLDPLCQELLEKAQKLYEELAQEHSDDPDVRRDIGLAWFRLGDIHRMRDQHAAAENAYSEAIAKQEELRRANPNEPRYREDLANSHNWLGELLRERGRPANEAERHYGAALELQQELVQQFASEPAYRMELARSHYNLGIVHKSTNRLSEARADYDQAEELLSKLHETDPGEPNTRQDLARALINRGVLHRLDHRPLEAGRDYDRALALLGQLRIEFPARAAYKFEMAIARKNRGNLLWSQGRLGDAQREHQEALVLFRGLVADFSSRPRYLKKMGNALKDFGAALASAGDQAGAEQSYRQARSLFEKLVRESPDNADYQGLLGMTLGNLGELRAKQEKWAEARRLIDQGIERMQTALKPNPQNPDYLQELRSQYQDLAETLVQLGDHAAVVQAATSMASVFPDRAQDSYYAACFIARGVPLAGKDDRLAQQYVELAVAFLREAAGKAPADLQRLPNEKQVFRTLQTHPEFSNVLRDFEARFPSR